MQLCVDLAALGLDPGVVVQVSGGLALLANAEDVQAVVFVLQYLDVILLVYQIVFIVELWFRHSLDLVPVFVELALLLDFVNTEVLADVGFEQVFFIRAKQV